MRIAAKLAARCGIVPRMVCKCDEQGNAFDTAVAAITDAAVTAAVARVNELHEQAVTAAADAGDERLVRLEARLADVESALATLLADVKVKDL